MRALFFGTPEIAVPALEALTQIATVVGVVCQPDKPAGRGLELKVPAVKARALALGLEVVQPTKVRTPELADWVRAREADVAIVMAYGRILPKAVLDGPRRGMLNLHASLLPKYRGAAPIAWAIVEGETKTGVALMQMDEGMDTGPVFTMHEVDIGPNMTAGELSAELARCAATVVHQDVQRAVLGTLVTSPQDTERATMARMLSKEDGLVPWSKGAAQVHNHVRGMTPWPGAFSTLEIGGGRKLFKVLETRRCEGRSDATPGSVILAHRGRIEIACGDGVIELVRGQLEGKKALGANDLVGGRALMQGQVLGCLP